jgi:hypothetical protein
MSLGDCVTLSDALAVFPSLLAQIVVTPGATAVTVAVSPFGWIDATVGILDPQVADRPVRTFPLASRSVSVAVVVSPALSVGLPNVSDALATGTCDTVTVTVPLLPPLVAVIVASPELTAVIVALLPLPLILAIDGLLELHEIGRLGIVVPNFETGEADAVVV